MTAADGHNGMLNSKGAGDADADSLSGRPDEAGGEGGSPADDGERSLVPESTHRIRRVRPDRSQKAVWRLRCLSMERDRGVLHRRSDLLLQLT